MEIESGIANPVELDFVHMGKENMVAKFAELVFVFMGIRRVVVENVTPGFVFTRSGNTNVDAVRRVIVNMGDKNIVAATVELDFVQSTGRENIVVKSVGLPFMVLSLKDLEISEVLK